MVVGSWEFTICDLRLHLAILAFEDLPWRRRPRRRALRGNGLISGGRLAATMARAPSPREGRSPLRPLADAGGSHLLRPPVRSDDAIAVVGNGLSRVEVERCRWQRTRWWLRIYDFSICDLRLHLRICRSDGALAVVRCAGID